MLFYSEVHNHSGSLILHTDLDNLKSDPLKRRPADEKTAIQNQVSVVWCQVSSFPKPTNQ
jgi:hypothetical protein